MMTDSSENFINSGNITGSSEKFEEIEAALAELEEALASRGITLPSLGIDLFTAGSTVLPPLVELGRCNAQTARALARALRARDHAH